MKTHYSPRPTPTDCPNDTPRPTDTPTPTATMTPLPTITNTPSATPTATPRTDITPGKNGVPDQTDGEGCGQNDCNTFKPTPVPTVVATPSDFGSRTLPETGAAFNLLGIVLCVVVLAVGITAATWERKA